MMRTHLWVETRPLDFHLADIAANFDEVSSQLSAELVATRRVVDAHTRFMRTAGDDRAPIPNLLTAANEVRAALGMNPPTPSQIKEFYNRIRGSRGPGTYVLAEARSGVVDLVHGMVQRDLLGTFDHRSRLYEIEVLIKKAYQEKYTVEDYRELENLYKSLGVPKKLADRATRRCFAGWNQGMQPADAVRSYFDPSYMPERQVPEQWLFRAQERARNVIPGKTWYLDTSFWRSS